MGQALYLLTFAAALGSALMAGTFFAFSAFVMAALGRLPPEQGAAAMQSINVVVLNPIFLGVFMGSAAIATLVAALVIFGGATPGASALLIGAALYVIGTFGVTIALNVPLNNGLAAIDVASQAGAEIWRRYLVDWTFWNHIRTAAALLATAAFIVGLSSATEINR